MLSTTLLGLAALAGSAAAAPYSFPNGTYTAPYPSGMVGSTGVASLTPTAYPNTIASNTVMALRPRSTASICPEPGHLVCSMDGRKVGVCGFTGDEDLQWMKLGDDVKCQCKKGECSIVDEHCE